MGHDWRADPATAAQLTLLAEHGYQVKPEITKGEASALIDQLSPTDNLITLARELGLQFDPTIITHNQLGARVNKALVPASRKLAQDFHAGPDGDCLVYRGRAFRVTRASTATGKVSLQPITVEENGTIVPTPGGKIIVIDAFYLRGAARIKPKQ